MHSPPSALDSLIGVPATSGPDRCRDHPLLTKRSGPVDLLYEAAVTARRRLRWLLPILVTSALHRDIKPGNLYELDGTWLIGDFGLIAVPEAKGLTVEAARSGPTAW
jgi:hypothetical protein